MSPLISLWEKEKKPAPNHNEQEDLQKEVTRPECGCGNCSCLKPCANCTCRNKKER